MKLTVDDLVTKGFSQSMAEHIAKHQSEPRPITPERILSIANRKGFFQVTLRYRDEKIVRMCEKLKREKKLTGGKRQGKVFMYYPAEAGRSALKEREG